MFQNLKSDRGQSLDEAYQPAQLKRDGYHTNNQYSKFPPLMSDGRIATDYRPSCVVHTLINEQNKVANSHQSRGFLQANAVKLMTMNQISI